MHWLLSLACVLAPAVYSQQDSGGLVSIWTTEWSAAWGDIQLQQARSSHTQIIKFTRYSFSAAQAASQGSEMLIFPTSGLRDGGDQQQCSRRLLYFLFAGVIYVQGEARGLGALVSWGMEVGDWMAGGVKSALLVFDPGQRYTRGHRTTAAVHLVEARNSACTILNHTQC